MCVREREISLCVCVVEVAPKPRGLLFLAEEGCCVGCLSHAHLLLLADTLRLALMAAL